MYPMWNQQNEPMGLQALGQQFPGMQFQPGMFSGGQRQNRLDYAQSLGYGGDMSGLHQYFQQLRQAGGTPIKDFRASGFYQQPHLQQAGNTGIVPPGMGSSVPPMNPAPRPMPGMAPGPQMQPMSGLAGLRRPGQVIAR